MLARAASYMWVVVVTVVIAYPSSGLPTENRPHEMWDDYRDFKVEAYQMREDFGSEPRYDCALQYYYYIPCPTYSWFWAYYGWEPGDLLGTSFKLPDQGTGGYDVCDPTMCQALETIRILDFAGYGTIYPGLFTVQMDVWCSDASPYPGYHLWSSGPLETHFGWNYIDVNEPGGTPLYVIACFDGVEVNFAVTMCMIGTDGLYPMIGFDNIGKALEVACELHERGCMPALYPRDWAGGAEPRVHSGYVGQFPFQYWPPLGMPDGTCVSPGSVCERGFVEAAWRIYMICSWP